MRTALITMAILLGSGFIAAAVVLKPTGFERCVTIIGGNIDREATRTGATLDPRDVEVEAARICAGQSPQ
jgi:hypothetical protein